MTEQQETVSITIAISKDTYNSFYNDNVNNLRRTLKKSADTASLLALLPEDAMVSFLESGMIPAVVMMNSAVVGFTAISQIIEAIIEIKEKEASHD